jgi:predicted transposase YbfD/YdcC
VKLLEILKKVKSKTSLKGRTYKVESIIALIMLGIACNCDSIQSIIRLSQELIKSQKNKLGFAGKMPSAGTIYYTLRAIDLSSLQYGLSNFANVSNEKRIIDIDGKTMRGSKKQNRYPHHMLSAFAREMRIVMHEIPLKNVGKEIPGCLELLAKLELKEDIIVCDAAFTQKAIIEAIVAKNSFFLMNIKGNQEKLRNEIKRAFDEKQSIVSRYTEDLQKNHGRIEQRNIEVMGMPWQYLSAWQYIQQIGRITRTRLHKSHGKWEEGSEVEYVITNLKPEQASAKQILELNRGHWDIENRLHWVKDKVFREDESNISDRNSCGIMSIIRSFIIHVAAKLSKGIKAIREFFSRKPSRAFRILQLSG